MTTHKNADDRLITRRRAMQGMVAAIAMPLYSASCGRNDTGRDIAPPPQSAESIPPGGVPMDRESLVSARNLLSELITVDVHCHPGMFFFEDFAPEDPAITQMAKAAGFEDRTISDMAVGGLTCGLLATVSDLPLIGFDKDRGLYSQREFEPGEAYADWQRQAALLQSMVDDGRVLAVRNAADIVAAKAANRIGAIFAAEGGDFLERRIGRIEEAYSVGIRSIGLVHYHVNEIGDIQTAAPVHGGLTDFGKDVVAEMNRLGILIDLAHATYDTTRDVVELTSRPVMVSHSFIEDPNTRHPRLLSPDHARLVAETGGLVGTWPAGIAATDFSTFIGRTLRLIDLVGVEHVGLGTDMDANFQPVFSNYQQLPHFVAGLRQGGLGVEDIAKVLGGNFVRVFAEVTGT